MKKITFLFKLAVTLMLFISISNSNAQSRLSMVVNSLADDEDAYPWDDPNTEADESRDGVCKDYQGRCTLRTAIEESSSIEAPLDLSFAVSGTINLIDDIYPYSHSKITANLPIEITGDGTFVLTDKTTLLGLTFNNMFTAVRVEGRQNNVGDWLGDVKGNTFINCYIGLEIDGDTNRIWNNRFGVDASNNLHGNNTAILSYGSFNIFGGSRKYNEGNIVCGSTIVGIYLAEGNRCFIEGNYVGTTPGGDDGFGNTIGIMVAGVDSVSVGTVDFDYANIVSGNQSAGISISGVPGESNSKNLYVGANIIGMDSARTKAIPNGQGIFITNGVTNGRIKNNVIAGNDQSAILLVGPDQESTISNISITGNKIGINDKGNKYPNGTDGIDVMGYVDHIQIGANSNSRDNEPNWIIGNDGYGILLFGDAANSPTSVTIRKNIIYQNETSNLTLTPFSNMGIKPPYQMTFNNNTIAGISDEPNVLIDIYKADINEFAPSAYQWIGSTTGGANGVFSYEINDPSIEAVSVTATTSDGNTSEFSYLELISGVDEEDVDPCSFYLGQNYPNPFFSSTTIGFTIPCAIKAGNNRATLKLYNLLGQEVATLVDEAEQPGKHEVEYNNKGLQSGIYYYRLTVGNFAQTRKLYLQ